MDRIFVQETAERIQDVMRVAREQDEIRNNVNKSNSYTPPKWSANPHSQMNGTTARFHGPSNM